LESFSEWGRQAGGPARRALTIGKIGVKVNSILCMVAAMRFYSAETSVRYGETDKMGIAHHSSYLLWFELGRTGLLRETGHSYRELEEGGLMLPVLECHVRFHVGAEYDDLVRIETAVSELRSRSVTFVYRAVRGDQLLATGWTQHVCVDPDNRLHRIPAEILEAMAPYVVPKGEPF
jgi:acyl-CoA thioester hydrolase